MATAISDLYKKIKQTKWTYGDNFNVQFVFGNTSLASKCGLTSEVLKTFEYCVKNVTIPQFSTKPQDVFINDRYFYTPGMHEVFEIHIDFYDYNQLGLYQSFLQYLIRSKYEYPADLVFKLILSKNADQAGQSDDFNVIEFGNCLMVDISNLTFGSSVDQILEFGVDIKSNDYTITRGSSVIVNSNLKPNS